MSNNAKTIYVYADWAAPDAPRLMGSLYTQSIRGKEIFSFEFAQEWLESENAFALDPDLQFYSGRQYASPGRNAFGLFLDSSPDRWGRRLILRREAILARKEERPLRKLMESDYLLEVHDATRMGALRFKLDESKAFLSNDSELPAPPWTSLRELESACRHYEEESLSDNEHEKWLTMLLAPGSSLGGARPKANVLDNESRLWIAKFPSQSDSCNIGAWEMVCHHLALKAGLNVPPCRIEHFSKHGSIFLTRRFDRKKGERIHFASAMTLLGRKDGDNYETGCSYLDIAQFIVRQGATPDADMEELWKRIVFSIAISNTDDHLRNHGFILTSRGWVLSPAYDINPNPQGTGLSLNISADDNTLDFDLALSIAPYFRLDTALAQAHLNHIKAAVSDWRDVAKKLNLSNRELNEMAPALRC